MLRNVIAGATLATLFALGAPIGASAQPPSPPEIVHKVDRGVRRAVTNVDRKLRRTGRRTHRTVRHTAVHRTTRRTVRTMCNDGRVHAGRTRMTACAGHGGVR
jgi:hypothetical protein